MSRTKAQMFAMDFMIAIVSFIIIITFLQVQQNKVVDQIRSNREVLIHDTLTSALDTMLIYPGYPEQWGNNSVMSLGLINDPHILNKTKLEQFLLINESYTRRLLGIRGLEFYFDVTFENKTSNYTKGVFPFENATNVFASTRKSIFEGEQVDTRLMLWTK